MTREALVIGAQGLIGRYLTQALTKAGITWQGTYGKRENSSLLKLDLFKEAEIKEVLLSQAPRVVFLCSNLSGGVDFSENHPELAQTFYVNAAQHLGTYCKEIQSHLFFISSDYVFNGENAPYNEEASPQPLNVYGRTKLEAEEWLKKHLSDVLIIRTTNVYGWDPETITPNYMMQLYRTLKENKPFFAPSYLSGQPTYAFDLAQAMVELYQKKAKGIYHIVGESVVNRWKWALHACDVFNFDRKLIQECTTPPSSFVPRPLKSQLNCQKFKSSFQTILHDLLEGLTLMKNDMRQK